jgi:DNA-binding transcriptional LysR family regulator
VQVKKRAVLGQLDDMDLRLLKVFRSVVQCGGMTAAELELNVGTSTISRHIKDLETRLGLVLCRRGRAGFALTQEGQRVYDETQRLLASVDTFRNGIDDIHGRMGGTLELAVFDKTISNPQAHIDDAIARFCALAPEVQPSLHVASINEIERGVIDGRFALGIIPAHRASRSLRYTELFGETMLLYCGRRHRLFGASHAGLHWEQLRDFPFAGLGYHSPNMELSHRERLVRRASGYDQEAIATLVLSGCFLGFLPDHYAAGFVAQGLLQPVAPARFSYACQFVSLLRRAPQPSRAALLFQDCLVAAHAAPPS